MFDFLLSELKEVENYISAFLDGQDKRVYGGLSEYILRGGKRFRPALCFTTYRLFGGPDNAILEPASLIELFHNFTLIHDDIEDNSDFRRGAPALHRSHGLAFALNAGDALYTLIWDKILDQRNPKMFSKAFKRVVEGQGIEISWIQNEKFNISEKEYFEMISGKTAALIGLSCEVGSYYAGGDNSKLREYGEYVGLAFQIRDDVLNLIGDFDKYKKEIGGDISEGKRTLIVIHALENSNHSERLEEILRMHSKDQKLINEAISIVRDAGSIDYAQKKAEEFANKAICSLENVPKNVFSDELRKLALYSVNRES